jgi:solute:Na+ symporter, SSS family
VPNLSAVDWLILLIYFFFTISVGLGLRESMTGSRAFLLAGRSLPGWLCGLAMTGASLGSLEVLGMGAAGARYGPASAAFFGLGSVIPLLFAALYMVPVYYGSKARSVPDYLRLRFDEKTRRLAALLMAATLILSAALALLAMARICASLHLFDVIFHVERLGGRGVLMLAVALFTAILLVYVLLGGLAATMYTQVMQFFLLLAAFLPLVYLGLKQVGGWGAMRTAFAAAAAAQPWLSGRGSAAETLLVATLLGGVLTAGYWYTDFSLLQTTFAAENAAAARRAPLLAAAARALLPFLLIVPGVIAIGLPTPHTSEVVRNENGAIYHEINVVPPAAEEGRGLVPAKTDSTIDPMVGKPLQDAAGHTILAYGQATPSLLPQVLPTGLAGLALAALFACLTSGVAGRIAAFNTIFTFDLYESWFRRRQPEKESLAPGRWAGLGAGIAAAGLACAALWLHNMPGVLDLLLITLAVFAAPMMGTLLLGMFWKRATAHGAFAGLIAGFAVAVAHYGLTVPVGEARGLAGGWIAPLHHSASALAQNAGAAILAFVVNVLVTLAVSLATAPRPQKELNKLVHSMAAPDARPRKNDLTLAAVILIVSFAVTLFFA